METQLTVTFTGTDAEMKNALSVAQEAWRDAGLRLNVGVCSCRNSEQVLYAVKRTRGGCEDLWDEAAMEWVDARVPHGAWWTTDIRAAQSLALAFTAAKDGSEYEVVASHTYNCASRTREVTPMVAEARANHEAYARMVADAPKMVAALRYILSDAPDWAKAHEMARVAVTGHFA